uniref:Putative CMP/dCMP deaminase zinc-binding n=1 Tax=viral metagenome TaxID=1070528 RepID=A0A6M3JPR2_9ZZZZ
MTNDQYFFNICNLVAEGSKCLSRKVGAILVKDNIVVITGRNGPPRGVMHCNERCIYDDKLIKAYHEREIDLIQASKSNTCPRQLLDYESGKGLEWCIAAHAERGCIVHAARFGISTKNCIMYMNCNVPCKDCLIEIINAGIIELVCVDANSYYDEMSEFLVKEGHLIIREYKLGD